MYRIYFSFFNDELAIKVSDFTIGKIKLFTSGEDFELYLTASDLGGRAWKNFKTSDPKLSSALCTSIGHLFNFMPNGREHSYKLPTEFYKCKKKIGPITFYGGSFNPWHEGHRECIIQCLRESFPEEVLVVPDHNPWKKGEERELPYKQFLDLCLSLKDENVSIYPGFLGRGESKNPTINWLPSVTVLKKSLLLGADNFEKFCQWGKYEKLVTELQKIYVLPRLISEEKLKRVESVLLKKNKTLEVIYLGPHPFEAISSRKIRELKGE